MRTERQMITPAKAENMLKKNRHNRTIFEQRVNSYAQDMAAGQWQENGQTISFSTEGALLDGQHRLAAIIKSGCTIPVLVVYDVDPKSFETIDSGRARTMNDVLTSMHLPYGTMSASVARILINFFRGTTGSTVHSRKELLGFLEANPIVQQTIAEFGPDIHKSHYPAGPLAAVMSLAGGPSGEHAIQVRNFIDGIRFGAALPERDPRLALRQWFYNTKAKDGAGSVNRAVKFMAVARAWNAYAQNRQLVSFRNLDTAPSPDTLQVVGFDPERWIVREQKVLQPFGETVSVIKDNATGKRSLKVRDNETITAE